MKRHTANSANKHFSIFQAKITKNSGQVGHIYAVPIFKLLFISRAENRIVVIQISFIYYFLNDFFFTSNIYQKLKKKTSSLIGFFFTELSQENVFQ